MALKRVMQQLLSCDIPPRGKEEKLEASVSYWEANILRMQLSHDPQKGFKQGSNHVNPS